jgi:hypothetical protein
MRAACALVFVVTVLGCASPTPNPGVDGGPGVDAARMDADIDDGSPPDSTMDAMLMDAFSDAAFDDAGPSTDSGPVVCEAGALDVLFVVDPSMSLAGTLTVIAGRAPAFLDALVSSGAFPGPNNMHVGVISTSLGLNGLMFSGLPASCALRPSGDDAVLQTTSRGVGCSAAHAPFLTYRSGDDLTAFAGDLGCALQIPTQGCSFEQPLEAALKALTASTSSLRFSGGTLGQADRANVGFRRPGAALAIIIITDEDDCSNDNPDVFDPVAPYSSLEVRCAVDATLLHPVTRYINRFLALAPPTRLAVVALAGFPEALAPTDFTGIRADTFWRLEVVGGTLALMCIHDFPTGAPPAFRLLELVEGIEARGGHGHAVSVCSRALGPAGAAPNYTRDCAP